MKANLINALAGLLSGIKINKISDKEVKTTLANDYLHLRRIVKKIEEDRNEIVEKFQQDWADELAAVESFRRDKKPVVGHDAYLEAERDANRAIAALFEEEVETRLKAVPMDAFLDALSEDELTLEQIALLTEGGIVE